VVSETLYAEYNKITGIFASGGGGKVWKRLNIKQILGIAATIAGIAVLIVGLPSWMWFLAAGASLIWCGWMLFTTKW